MERRDFIKNTGLIAGGLGMLGTEVFAKSPMSNKLPQWRGFNLVDFNTIQFNPKRKQTTEDQLKWMSEWGFNFVRLPISYPYYLDFDRSKKISPDEVYKMDESALDRIDNLVHLAHKYNLHVSLNLHRAPGYCINAGFHEPYNLWKDEEAMNAFAYHWNMWAKRYKEISSKKISFDLLNEPSMREDMNDQLSRSSAVPGELYRKMAIRALEAIKKENNTRIVVADGNNVGNNVIPEITDLDIAQSCRGYYPHAISHFKAPWANKDPENLPVPVYPGKIGNQEVNRAKIEAYYKSWIDLVKQGVGVHCGECGCWNKTPHEVYLTWFNDVLDILSENKIGFALWEFAGDFGVLNSGRPDITYEDWYGYKLDRKLLTLLQKY